MPTRRNVISSCSDDLRVQSQRSSCPVHDENDLLAVCSKVVSCVHAPNTLKRVAPVPTLGSDDSDDSDEKHPNPPSQKRATQEPPTKRPRMHVVTPVPAGKRPGRAKVFSAEKRAASERQLQLQAGSGGRDASAGSPLDHTVAQCLSFCDALPQNPGLKRLTLDLELFKCGGLGLANLVKENMSRYKLHPMALAALRQEYAL